MAAVHGPVPTASAGHNGITSEEPKVVVADNGKTVDVQDKGVSTEGLCSISAYDQWTPLSVSGQLLKPRYKHGAAVVQEKMYVFGGNHNGRYLGDIQVLDFKTLSWSKLEAKSQSGPSESDEAVSFAACAGHSLIPWGNKILCLAGHTREPTESLSVKEFDPQTCTWSTLRTYGSSPSSRGGQSVTLVGETLVVFGGEGHGRSLLNDLHILDLETLTWDEFETTGTPPSPRSEHAAACFAERYLLIFGGGSHSTCFGDLHLLDTQTMEWSRPEQQGVTPEPRAGHAGVTIGEHWFLTGGGNSRKGVSDTLVLNMSTYEWSVVTSLEVRAPPTSEGSSLVMHMINGDIKIEHDDPCTLGEPLAFTEKKLSGDNLSLQNALKILSSCNGSFLKDELAISRKPSKSPQTIMKELVSSLLESKGMPSQLLGQLPARWETLGDIIILPKTCFKDPLWESVSEELWPLVAKSLGTQRLARQGKIMPNGTRDSTLELLLGDNGWVTHHENGIRYSLDATKCMFSSGNRSEKLRMGQLNCRDEVVVDLFAGIGYFVLPFLVKANAKFIYACEWNPHALEALRRNVRDNHVEDRCIVLEGDNRVTAPKGVADRVCLGLLPSSECSWPTAVRALRIEGGLLHIHGNVNDSDETQWLDNVVESIGNIAKANVLSWSVSLEHVERVKWYGPHIRHLVVDVRCRPI